MKKYRLDKEENEILEAIEKAKAAEEGIPYQTLVADRPMNYSEMQEAVEAAYRDYPGYWDEFDRALMRHRLEYYEIVELGPVEGFSARGWLGQYLVIDAKRSLVGVRMRQS